MSLLTQLGDFADGGGQVPKSCDKRAQDTPRAHELLCPVAAAPSFLVLFPRARLNWSRPRESRGITAALLLFLFFFLLRSKKMRPPAILQGLFST